MLMEDIDKEAYLIKIDFKKNQCARIFTDINQANINMTGLGAYAAYLLG